MYIVCASDAATMVAYVGCCVGSGTGNHFLEHWRTKLQMLAKYAARHVKHRISKVCVGVSYQSCYHWIKTAKRKNCSTSSNKVVIVYCYIGCEDEVTTWYYSKQLIEVANTYDFGVVSHIN